MSEFTVGSGWVARMDARELPRLPRLRRCDSEVATRAENLATRLD